MNRTYRRERGFRPRQVTPGARSNNEDYEGGIQPGRHPSRTPAVYFTPAVTRAASVISSRMESIPRVMLQFG
jgi:hypothetical protein